MSRARGTPFAVGLGVVSAAFFAVTFVLNRGMAVAQGHPAWTASLRFLLMVPLLALLLAARRQGPALVRAWRAAPGAWVTWGTVGFVVFYVPLVVAAAWVPAWVVAGTWPLTILAGVLLAPLLYTDARCRIPGRALASSLGIVAGVVVLQAAHAGASSPRVAIAGFALVAVAAVSLTTFARVPWNAPYYARLGFRTVDDADLSPALRDLLRAEADAGLPPEHRVAMRLDLPSPRTDDGR